MKSCPAERGPAFDLAAAQVNAFVDLVRGRLKRKRRLVVKGRQQLEELGVVVEFVEPAAKPEEVRHGR